LTPAAVSHILKPENEMNVSFSDFFKVPAKTVEQYGAFDISLLADLPLFVDPFLLFNSKKPVYRKLHDQMIGYLRFLREKSSLADLDPDLIRAWYLFPEVSQNWLGFSKAGNKGRGLGRVFADALHQNLGALFRDFGNEKVTKGSHLEKLCLIRDGVGKDNISDFTNNLIHQFLLEYTQTFSTRHIAPALRKTVAVQKVRFNYQTETWESGTFDLPWFDGDHVLLTPRDILTRDETWINKNDLVKDFESIPAAIPNEALRAQVNNYFLKVLPRDASRDEEREAVTRTILQFPALIDYYIKYKEDNGTQAEDISTQKVALSKQLYLQQFKDLVDLLRNRTAFYSSPGVSYEEAEQRVAFLKDVIENKGGHRIFYVKGKPIEREEDLHILYRMTWYASESDVTREANDGRGPVDFKVSKGSKDKALVEFKLAKNSQLARNLQKQADIYQRASDAPVTIKVIIYFSASEKARVENILGKLKLTGHPTIVLIDARRDNKPSGSRA
jgi:hypothetical protein